MKAQLDTEKKQLDAAVRTQNEIENMIQSAGLRFNVNVNTLDPLRPTQLKSPSKLQTYQIDPTSLSKYLNRPRSNNFEPEDSPDNPIELSRQRAESTTSNISRQVLAAQQSRKNSTVSAVSLLQRKQSHIIHSDAENEQPENSPQTDSITDRKQQEKQETFQAAASISIPDFIPSDPPQTSNSHSHLSLSSISLGHDYRFFLLNHPHLTHFKANTVDTHQQIESDRRMLELAFKLHSERGQTEKTLHDSQPVTNRMDSDRSALSNMEMKLKEKMILTSNPKGSTSEIDEELLELLGISS